MASLDYSALPAQIPKLIHEVETEEVELGKRHH